MQLLLLFITYLFITSITVQYSVGAWPWRTNIGLVAHLEWQDQTIIDSVGYAVSGGPSAKLYCFH